MALQIDKGAEPGGPKAMGLAWWAYSHPFSGAGGARAGQAAPGLLAGCGGNQRTAQYALPETCTQHKVAERLSLSTAWQADGVQPVGVQECPFCAYCVHCVPDTFIHACMHPSIDSVLCRTSPRSSPGRGGWGGPAMEAWPRLADMFCCGLRRRVLFLVRLVWWATCEEARLACPFPSGAMCVPGRASRHARWTPTRHKTCLCFEGECAVTVSHYRSKAHAQVE